MKKLGLILLFFISYSISMQQDRSRARLSLSTTDTNTAVTRTIHSPQQPLPVMLPTNSFEQNQEIALILLQHAKRSRTLPN